MEKQVEARLRLHSLLPKRPTRRALQPPAQRGLCAPSTGIALNTSWSWGSPGCRGKPTLDSPTPASPTIAKSSLRQILAKPRTQGRTPAWEWKCGHRN